MYTWGYIKDATLAKLDLEQSEANVMGLLNRFVFYANEAMTQICSGIKPKHSYFVIKVDDENVNKLLTMDVDDFISFGDDESVIAYINEYGDEVEEFCHDDVLVHRGYNNVICKKKGLYTISYNARWYMFSNATPDDEVLNVPVDILDCIPSYIAHQCMKTDDEYKSSVLRNEYEMFLSRIDDTDYNTTKTIKILGDW